MALTDPACKNAKCPEGKARERFSDSGGLYLEATPNGSKLWRWKYRHGGKEKRLALGAYPEVSLAQARRDRDAARATLKAGTDPAQQRKEAKLADGVKLANNFEAIAKTWHETWKVGRSPRHADYVLRRLEADVFPTLGAKAISDITALDFIAISRAVEKRGAVDIAKRLWQTCGQVCEYAMTVKGIDGEALLTRNPARDLKPSVALMSRKKEHYARLDAREFPELLRKVEGYRGAPVTRFAMQLLALTFVRTTELIGARWGEFDLEAAEWRIPAARMKVKTTHIVPLSTQAVDVLCCLQELRGLGDLLFPGERDHEKPMSNNTILKALERLGYKHRMTGHGYRGLASTILHEAGFDHMHIELQLAHMERDDTSAAYNFATYLPQRRKMLQWYADHLDQIRQGAKVLPFKAA